MAALGFEEKHGRLTVPSSLSEEFKFTGLKDKVS
jgi:hypothetical protein